MGILVFLGLIAPLPLYSETPGEADALDTYIKIDGKDSKVNGEYMITAVYLQRLTGLTALLALANPQASILSENEANGGTTASNNQKMNQIYMDSAVNEAKATAFKAAGIEYERVFNGIYVMAIQDNSNFKKYLSIGDTVTEVDGKHFDAASGYQKYIRSRKVGTKMTITYTHDGKSKKATAQTVALAGTKKLAGIGIALTDDVTVTSDTKVTADMGDIGGPSGGLMFSLQMYDALTPDDDLARGRKIAGTGTIDKDGNVGEIGGIDKKVIVAHNQGAKIFFAPYIKPTKENLKYEEDGKTNYQLAVETAKKYAPDMKVVPVKTFQDAVNYLQNN